MRRCNRIFAVLLATTFVAGSLAAPLSHFVWMAASGHFGHADHHHNSVPAHGLPADGSLSQFDAGACTYSELFATHLSSEPVGSAVFQDDTSVSEFTQHLPDWGTVDGTDKVLARGPPAA